MWNGDYGFALRNLVNRDFKIRYRNMSLGIFWSLFNPLIMMGLLTFIFTSVFPNSRRAFPVFVLCGLVPFNFLATSWASGTNCLIENAGLVKRVPLPRLIIPIASVLSNCLHLLIQIALLLSITIAFGFAVNPQWAFLPLIWLLEILFVMGLVMASSALDVYFRDVRYIVESANLLLFWIVPIFYPLEAVPARYSSVYQYNPVSAIVLALRKILMEALPPPSALLWKLSVGSILVFVIGCAIFLALQKRFYERL